MSMPSETESPESPESSASVTIALILDGASVLSAPALTALYRITGRSTVELRLSAASGEPIYAAELFGADHIDVVPRLEKTAAFLADHGVPFLITETVDGESAEIPREVLESILGEVGGGF